MISKPRGDQELRVEHSRHTARVVDMPGSLRSISDLAVELAGEAAQLHRQGLKSVLEIEAKSSPTDLVSQIDRESEQLIVQRLAVVRPDDAILAEEGTLSEGSSGVRWVIDPLDGTANYVHRYPAFAVSIAVEIDGQPMIGVVHDSNSGCCYRAVSGFGAFCDDEPIEVSTQSDMARSLVGAGFSYDTVQRQQQGAVIARLLGRVSDIRRGGAAALDICHVAAGHLAAFWELDDAPWDYAAGAVIAREAGADVLFPVGAHGRGPAVVAANPVLMPSFLSLLYETGSLLAPG